MTFTTEITSLIRLRNSRNGAPQWKLTFTTSAPAFTKTDSVVNWELGQWALDQPVEVTLDETSRVVDVRAID